MKPHYFGMLMTVYADNQYRSHCGSCHDSWDEEVSVALVPFDEAELQLRAREYCLKNMVSFDPMAFIDTLSAEFIGYRTSGTSYPPDFVGAMASGKDIEITRWGPEKLLSTLEYGAYKTAEEEKHRRIQEAKEAAKKLKDEEDAKAKEAKERARLAELKAKYPDA